MERDRKLGVACGASAGEVIALVFLLLISGTDQPPADVPPPPPDTADQVFSRAIALAKASRLDQAQTLFERGLAEYPRDKRFPTELAGIAFRKNDRRLATRYLHMVLKIDGEDRYAREFLGSIYFLDGNIPAALDHWNRIGKPLIARVQVSPPPAGAVGSEKRLLLDRAIAVSPGQILTLARYNETLDNFRRAGIFSSARWELTPAADDRFELTIRSGATGLPLQGWLGRTLPLASGLPYETLYLGPNLFRWDSNKRRVALEYAEPLRENPRNTFRLFLGARDERWRVPGPNLDFRLREVTGGGNVLFAIHRRLEWITGGSIAFRSFTGNAFPKGWLLEFPNEFHYALLRLPAHRLTMDSAAILRTGRVTGGSGYQVAGTDVQLSWCPRWYPQWNPRPNEDDWHIGTRLRDAKTWGTMPFDRLFELGLDRDNELSLRGHSGIRGGPKGSAPLGKSFVLWQTQLDRRVFRKPFVDVSAGPFFDLGQAWGGYGQRGWLPDSGVQAEVRTIGRLTVTVSYGRDLRGARGTFFASVSNRWRR